MKASPDLSSERQSAQNFLTVEQCRKLAAPLRDDLELLDYEVRRNFNRIFAEIERSEKDSVLFLKASATAFLTIAAGLMDRAAEIGREPFDVASFKAVAEDAAQWAKTRRSKRFEFASPIIKGSRVEVDVSLKAKAARRRSSVSSQKPKRR